MPRALHGTKWSTCSAYPTRSHRTTILLIAPQGYGVTSEAREHINNDPNIEEVIVTVTFEGEVKLVVETMRVR
jgi:hypothetical protein